ncbi:MAG TPA: serine/threonine-protein kinase [Polyangia bacterium]|nr:serine/threonine-protein kinase [Polyangia bacterium]
MVDEPSSPASPHDEETTLPAGARLGKYEIVRLIGSGGMGAVYEATHVEIGKRVAIKTLAPAVAAVAGARQRFLREAQLTSRLRHPNIVDMTDMGTEGRIAYLVMELLVGEDLAHRLERTGPMVPSELVDLMLPVCSALVAAHAAGIVHRDLKPQNIFLAAAPGGVAPKVLDFGISKSNDNEASYASLTGTGAVIGTPHYLAPEQIQDARSASAASDQYSIGVIFYRCLTGTNPFAGESVFAIMQAIVGSKAVPLAERRPDLPEGLAEVLAQAMNPLPWERYGSIQALGRELVRFASPKARVIWEDAFAERTSAEAQAAPAEAAVRHPVSLTTPMPSPQPQPMPRSPVSSEGTLVPAVTATERVPGLGRRAWIVGGAVVGIAVAVAIALVSTRGHHLAPSPVAAPVTAAPPPAAPAAPRAPAAETAPANAPVTPGPTATTPAPTTAAPKVEAAPTAKTAPEGPPPASRRAPSGPAKPPRKRPDGRRSLNPNGAPVID